MVDVVVFGTGSNGERAWRAAAARPDIRVVCFADNDARKQGTRVHGLTIIAPEDLGRARWDFIVLASMYAPEMQRQLHGMGVPADSIVASDPSRFDLLFADLPARKHLRPYVDKATIAAPPPARPVRLEDLLTDRVHYACGRNVIDGWLNVDVYDDSYPYREVLPDGASRIFRVDLTGPHPFPSDYFRLGYSEDFVEHLTQPEFIAFLCECHRTFTPGGVLRLSSPGLDGMLRRHLRGSDHAAAARLRDEVYERWWHKHVPCFEEINLIARHIGWREVRQVPYGESAVPELRQDTRSHQADLNLVVELVK